MHFTRQYVANAYDLIWRGQIFAAKSGKTDRRNESEFETVAGNGFPMTKNVCKPRGEDFLHFLSKRSSACFSKFVTHLIRIVS